MSFFSANRFIPSASRFSPITSSYRALKNMFSTETATESDAADAHSYLLNTSHDLLEDHLAAKESELDFSLKDSHIDNVAFAAFDHGALYDRYDESGPSSVQPGDNNDFSEPSGSHMSLRDEADDARPAVDGAADQQDVPLAHDTTPAVAAARRAPSTAMQIDTNGMSKMISDELEMNHHSRLQRGTPEINVAIPAGAAALADESKDQNILNPSSRGAQRNSVGGRDTPRLSDMSIKQESPGLTGRPTGYPPIGKNLPAFRAKSSIPAHIPMLEFARQCILAAQSSRLNPFALHTGEYELLRDHITHAQVTVYLNIRNAILRLWTRNPLVAVMKAEAAGCARDPRYFNMSQVAYKWLVRNGYINYGCVELQSTAGPIPRAKARGGKRRTIVVVGAGMAGLGCARQLEGLIAQLGEQWTNSGERPPRVVVLEGRKRIGGRVYSHPLKNQSDSTLPPGLRNTVEMGAQIITGFEHGNPLNCIIRGQLALRYHTLKDDTIIYDTDGAVVDQEGDMLVEKLYNDILERASQFRNKHPPSQTVEGDRRLLQLGRDPANDSGELISSLEDSGASQTVPSLSTNKIKTTVNPNALMGVEKSAGRAYTLAPGSGTNVSAAEAAKNMGWQLKPGTSIAENLRLDSVTQVPENPTLGATMDEAIKQYQGMVQMTPKHMRLFNWHHANMEYSNAAHVNQLSLGGWDQDIGNEFEGPHSHIIGGYQQLPRGLWQNPAKLDVRFNSPVKAVREENSRQVVECENGDIIEADEVVVTTPLGVLKRGAINFNPPLPEWKMAPIQRLGFGLLNKVALVYDTPFWETDRDIFGTLNEAELQNSMEQRDYELRRGRFWLFWNCIKTSGRPTLIALMAGNAAHDTEVTDDKVLVREVTERLSKMFAPAVVPLPTEHIVTRWKKDPFAGGSYSFMGPTAQPGDYDAMARPIGSLHFAGEATCGTHPATVHGAYLSGLRAASEVVDSMLGPIEVQHPLVPTKAKPGTPTPIAVAGTKHGRDEMDSVESRNVRQARNEDLEALITAAILEQIGERPHKPERTGNNPYLLYTRDQWHTVKAECDEQRRAATGDPNAKASKDHIRTVLGAKWRNAPSDVQQPYLDEANKLKEASAAAAAEYKEKSAVWEKEAARIRTEFMTSSTVKGEFFSGKTAIENGSTKRDRRVAS
ncbi:High mobility group HMG1/HMG2 [Botryosphaeria dothidea]|uniref:High mobility group HMG1/HMG2 n=1 Tax=Botryosphaeria dothidea TaxID=55169 RepID=A0A8H4J0I5_9PEZI|nr:High mobility group HMG1/HMG2 [Botryosphaeria dothidea]